MASISHDKKTGRRTIQFKDTDGSRKSIRLGKCDQKTAQAIRTQIEHLPSASGEGERDCHSSADNGMAEDD